jgi:hypothetical protein
LGNRKKLVVAITGAAALVVAPFIHNAFSAAATSDDPNNVSASTQDATPAPTNNGSTASTESTASTDNGDKDAMPVSVSTEINNGHATVTVNGETSTVPEGDSIHKTINDDGTTTTVNVSNDGGNVSSSIQSTGEGRTRINSHTSSSVKINTNVSSKETIH